MSNQGWTQNDSFDNWDDVSTEAPKPPEDGFYCFEVVEAKAQPTSKQAKPAVNLTLSLTAFYQGDELPIARKVFDMVAVTKESAFRVKQLFESIGAERPTSNSADYLPDWAAGLVGLSGIAQIKQETYKAKDGEMKTVARVKRYHTTESADKARSGGASEGDAASNGAPVANTRRRRGGATAQA